MARKDNRKMKFTSPAWLKRNEPLAIAESFAMMAYNPSIGRVLGAGGVKKFKKIAVRKLSSLKHIRNQEEFYRFHDRFVQSVIKKIKKTSTKKDISYGQGQKPVNVFLKVYIDWASYPNRTIANRLKKFLHLPLDRYVMWYIKRERYEDFDKIVKPIYQEKGIDTGNLSLSRIDKDIYYAWQRLAREICPEKPVLLDVIWAKAPR